MNRFGKLVHFELSRFIKIYASLIVITIISQIVGVFVVAKEYVDMMNEEIYANGITIAQFVDWNGLMNMLRISRTIWFFGPIFFSAAALVFYVFLIWYRDWFGKNTFIYRLLMLPTARLNVFMAKATSILLMVLGLVSVQLILLLVENKLLKWIVPTDFRLDLTVYDVIVRSEFLGVIIPGTWLDFLLSYGAGLMCVFILFTAILFERSFRWKGALVGGIYAVLAGFIFLSPIMIENATRGGFFYPKEVFMLVVITGILVTTMSLLLSNYLLKNKITI